MKDGKIENLPKWAQKRIQYLMRDLEHARTKLREAYGVPDGPVVLNAYSDERVPLPVGTSVSFYQDADHYFMVSYDSGEGRLEIYSSHRRMVVYPRTGNSIHLGTEPL